MASASALQGASSGFTKVGIDPTGGVGGQVLANLVNFPTVEEQVGIIRSYWLHNYRGWHSGILLSFYGYSYSA